MNRSFRLTMEDNLNNDTLTQEILYICIAKINPSIDSLAYKEKQYANYYCGGSEERKQKRLDLSEIRQPMIDVLMKQYNISFDDILVNVKGVNENKIPTMQVCERVKDIINNGVYLLK